MGEDGPAAQRTGRRWRRGEEPEFTRLTTFVDAVFAIALTLLVLDLRLPPLHGPPDDPGTMLTALGDLVPAFVAYGVAFALLGRYWLAHHDFSSRLGAIDTRLIGLTLVYLAFVALLPFPSSLVGEHEGNPVSVLVFAVVLAVISTMETVLLAHAHRSDLLLERPPPAEYRRWLVDSLQPVAVFVVTMPLAFVSTTLTLLSWAVVSPLIGAALDRRLRRRDAPA